MKKLKSVVIAIAFLAITVGANAQRGFNVQGDIVSSYVWRGQYQTGASIQPTLGFYTGGFSLTAWGSMDITGKNKKEVDLTAAYSIKGFTISVADLWWAGEQTEGNSGREKYFMFESKRTDHIFEAALAYTIVSEKFPLSVAWYTMFGGYDKLDMSNKRSKQAYSSYVEFNYPFLVKGINLNATMGLTPWNAAQYGTNSFAITNIALKATKEIQISKKFSFPIFTQIIWNPNKEDVHLVFGITLK